MTKEEVRNTRWTFGLLVTERCKVVINGIQPRTGEIIQHDENGIYLLEWDDKPPTYILWRHIILIERL